MIYILSILFVLTRVLYQKYQFKNGTAGKWHFWGWIEIIVFFLAFLLYRYFPFSWADFFLSGAICMVGYPIAVNMIALSKSVFYVGNTSEIDKRFGKKQWFVYFGILIAASIFKLLTFKNKKL